MKKIGDFFGSKALLVGCGFVGAAAFLVSLFMSISMNGNVNTAMFVCQDLLSVVLPLTLLHCYKKGETSCQKALVGALLMFIVMISWMRTSKAFGIVIPGRAISVIVAMLYTILLFNHLLLQAEHKGDGLTIAVNQLVMMLTLVMVLVQLLCTLIRGGLAFEYLYGIGCLALTGMIVCIETRIQTYKQIRAENMAAGTWTEEERQKAKALFRLGSK